jgi:organic radical activating enzyme
LVDLAGNEDVKEFVAEKVDNVSKYVEEKKQEKGAEWEEYLRKGKETQRLQKEKVEYERKLEEYLDQTTDKIKENINDKKRGWFSNWFSSDDRFYKERNTRDIYEYGNDEEKYDYLKSKYSEKDYVWRNY